MKEKPKYEFLTDFDINDIEIATRERKWASIMDEWVKTNAKTLKFTLKNQNELAACKGAIGTYKRNHGYDWTIVREKATYNIYVVRAK